MGDARCIQAQNRLEHERGVHSWIDRRVGAHEEQLQPVIWKLCRQGHLAFLPQELESGLTCHGHLLMTHKIDEGMARCSQQPGLWILRHTVLRPCLEGCYQRLTESVLRAGHVVRVRAK